MLVGFGLALALAVACLACEGAAFSVGDASAPEPDASSGLDGSAAADASSPDVPGSSDASPGLRDSAPLDGSVGIDAPDALDGSADLDTSVRDAGSDTADREDAGDARCACSADTQQPCTPACGQWAGLQTCAADCSGYGACVTTPFTWSASAVDGGFLHECSGAVDRYGNWQTDYTPAPNGCLAQYGPYLQVPRGAYQANVQVWGTADTVVVSITNHNGTNTLQSSGDQALTAGWSTIAVPDFRIDDDMCTGVEMRVQWSTANAVAIVVGPSSLVRTGP
jgi:hypothetical protein